MVHDPWAEVLAEAQALRRRAEEALGLPPLDVAPERPPEGMGDLALPAFPYARPLGLPPAEAARRLADALPPGRYLRDHRAVGGYVNSSLDWPPFLGLVLASVLDRGAAYGDHPARGRRVLVEHTSVNPNGPIHVGRARNPLIGDALARLLRRAGYEVTREFLVNDVGRQIILMYWGVKHLAPGEVAPPPRARGDYRLVAYYQAATRRAEEDPRVEEEVRTLAQRYEAGDAALAREVRSVCEEALGGILESLGELGIAFDRFFWESSTILDGTARAIAERLQGLPQAGQEPDGAWYLDLGGLGIAGEAARWIFLRRDGTTLYTTRDLAYHLDKFKRCDLAVNVLGEDQKLGAQQLAAALRLLGVDRQPEPVFYAFVVLPEGRLSTRRGRVIYLDDLVDEALDRAYAEVDKRRPDLPEEAKRRIARVVGLGALKYNYLRVQPEKKIVFRWEEALNFEGNSAPFLQYAHARTCGILEKAGGYGRYDAGLLVHPSERNLAKALALFPSTVAEAAEGRKPHAVAAYAYGTAGLLNQFYRDCPVIHSPEPLRSARLALVDATRVVLANALDALGIEAPEEM